MLRRDHKVELIAGVPLFGGCSKKHLQRLAGIADEIDLRQGKVLTRQGGTGREFFILLEGEVDVTRDGKTVNTLGPGEFFGEMALIGHQPRSATVTATTPIRALVMTEMNFKRLLRDHPDISIKVLETMASRVEPGD
jgi:CRP/FNR family transcriptional regulator, cyclic AMP receptor protein